MKLKRLALGLLALTAPVFGACTNTAPESFTPPTVTPPAQLHTAKEYTDLYAVDILQQLRVKGRAPRTGYSRAEFGKRWADVDNNGCDTRNDILGRDLYDVVHKPGTHGCIVMSGTLHNPYTGETMLFTRGDKSSAEVPVDHVVALSDAWQKGAANLSPEIRAKFANDPLNLLAVDHASNTQKGDSDAASWLPANKSFRCEYVARQIGVKAAYHLWVTEAEKNAMIQVLELCPTERIPAGSLTPIAEDGVVKAS